MLTQKAVDNAKPREKPYKLFDERGLFLLVSASGGQGAVRVQRWWRFKYKLAGEEKGISLGTYPDVSLKRAREKRDEARRLVADGIDPSAKRKAEKKAGAETFEAIALEWLGKQPFSEKTRIKAEWTFNKLLFPYIGSRPVAKLERAEILEVLRRLEARGKHETAHRTANRIGKVLRYAMSSGRRTAPDPTYKIGEALTPVTAENHASIKDPAGIGELLRAIDGYSGQPTTEAALKLAPLVFVRPGELRGAEWTEFVLDGAEPVWRIPASRMKGKREHLVPLAPQVVSILRALQPLTGHGRYVFPSLRSSDRPLSENAITAALRRMGYDGDTMTWHGFRSMASTRLNEATKDGAKLWHTDWIERQLAHVDGSVRGDYNAAEYIGDRRRMMVWWADYLDKLRQLRSEPA